MDTNADLSGSNHTEEEERLHHLMAEVFSLEEIVQIILKFVPDQKSLKDILTLRKVCKLWKKVCFNVMLECDCIPITINLNGSYPLEKFTGYVTPDCSFPISVKLEGEQWLLEQLNFLHEYSKNIVRVKFPTIPAKDVNIPEDKYKILLPRLRAVHVVSPRRRMFHQPGSHAAVFIREITNTSRHTNLKDFVVQLGDKNRENHTDYSLLPPFREPEDDYLPANITHLSITDQLYSNEDIFSYTTNFLTSANLPNLRSLYFKAYGDAEYSMMDEILTILNKFASNLVHLRIKHDTRLYSNSRKRTQKIPKLPLLETLKLTDVCIASKNDDFASSDCGSRETIPTFTNLSACNGQHENLKELSLYLTPYSVHQGSNRINLPDVAVACESFFSTCSNLETLSITCSRGRVASLILQKTKQLTNLRTLRITIESKKTLPANKNNACYMLTGLKQNEIPDDRDSWKGLLEGNQNSISNLKQLSKLSLKFNPSKYVKRYWNLTPFVSYAFLGISNLKQIRLEGFIKVDKDFVDTWRVRGHISLTCAMIENVRDGKAEEQEGEDNSDLESEEKEDSDFEWSLAGDDGSSGSDIEAEIM